MTETKNSDPIATAPTAAELRMVLLEEQMAESKKRDNRGLVRCRRSNHSRTVF